MFGSAVDTSRNMILFERFFERSAKIIYFSFPFLLSLTNSLLEKLIILRMESFENMIFKFGFEFIHTQTMGKRCVNIPGFQSNSPLSCIRHMFKRPHIMKTVSQFNQQHSNIFSNTQKHSAKIFSLLMLPAVKFNIGDLSNAFDKISDLTAEAFFYILLCIFSILDNVVQKSASQSYCIHTHFTKNQSSLIGMLKKWLSRFPFLPFMGLFGKLEDRPNQLLFIPG